MKSEELKEEIKKILLDNPSIIADVIVSKPEIIYQVLAKLTPWQSLATKDDIREVKNSLSKLEIKVTSLEEKVEDIDKQFATKDDISKLVTKEEAKQFATKDDISKLESIINAIGARWGIMSESSFRNGIYEILKDIGWEIKNEIIYDREGYVYNEPSEIEIDIVIKDGNTMIIEIMSSLKRSDLPIIKKKTELYEKKNGVKVNQIIVITPFIHDKYQDQVIAMANSMGIKIITSLDNIK
ncbi:PD-(D/E)XK nuclease family protein [Caldisphaera sp.]|uniref:PD-(D/E)XK nuclease family protein n=1 Tax=Caldisphaera sp. TaxID=2060322 RepID=UPI0025C30251|nr:PD-(D/E)XK nuclease family protein [Caldisphaera sp.]